MGNDLLQEMLVNTPNILTDRQKILAEIKELMETFDKVQLFSLKDVKGKTIYKVINGYCAGIIQWFTDNTFVYMCVYRDIYQEEDEIDISRELNLLRFGEYNQLIVSGFVDKNFMDILKRKQKELWGLNHLKEK